MFLIDILIYDNSDSDFNYINNSLLLEVDFINRQELNQLAILLRIRR